MMEQRCNNFLKLIKPCIIVGKVLDSNSIIM
jgi:hypothetical protein